MKRLLLILAIITFIFTSCKNKELPIAEVYNHKLYLSQIDMPNHLSQSDSLIWIHKYVDSWLKNQILLYNANKNLSVQEKNFEKELNTYKNQLLLDAYYNKISETYNFPIGDQEAQLFLTQYTQNQNEKRALVRINYVKLDKNSKIAPDIIAILFDENRRKTEKETIERLCADSVEYFIDDNVWLYLDYIENEFSFKIENREELHNKNMNISDNNYQYIVVFLDYKTHYLSTNVEEELEIAKKLLKQEKMATFLDHFTDSLYQSTIDNKLIIR